MTIAASQFFSRAADTLPQQVEDAFFSSIKNPNNTFKCTWGGRFDEIDQQLVQALKRRRVDLNELLDIGVSSGATTLDLCDALRQEGFRPRIMGTDYMIHAWIVPLGANCSALLNEDGQLLQADLFGWSMRPWRRRMDFLTGMWLIRPILTRRLGRRAARKLREGIGVRKVELVSPRLRDHDSISVVQDNVLVARDAFSRRFDLIRAANVLNENYFPRGELKQAVENLCTYLRGAGSLLFIVRTLPSGEHHGTLFALNEQGALEVVERIGAGSEIEGLLSPA